MVKKTLSQSDVFWLFLTPRYSLPTSLFLDDNFFNIAVGVVFTSSSTIRTSKTIDYDHDFLEVYCSKVVVVSEVSGVYFVLTFFVVLISLFLSELSDFVFHRDIFPHCSDKLSSYYWLVWNMS